MSISTWVHTSKQLPEMAEGDDESVPALYVAHGEIFLGVYCPAQRCWFANEGIGHDNETEVSHWMPLPALPEAQP